MEIGNWLLISNCHFLFRAIHVSNCRNEKCTKRGSGNATKWEERAKKNNDKWGKRKKIGNTETWA